MHQTGFKMDMPSSEQQESIHISRMLNLDDHREFPSLNSGTTQNASSQSTWGNPTPRTSHTLVQRPQQNSNNPQSNTLSQPQQSQQLHQEDLFPSSSQFANGLDDYRFGGQNAVGQGAGSSQPQTTNIEDFPPLGRTENGEIGQDRIGGLME
jgi:CCR4-NOT transcription complex subunit 2